MAQINFDELREIAAFLKEQDLQEIWVERKDYKIGLVRRRETSSGRRKDEVSLSTASKDEDEAGDISITLPSITAPLVGIFRRQRTPSSPPLLNAGDPVETGQVVGYIEAMKMLNEVKSSVSGRVASILVEDGHPVEYGQVLLLVETET